MKDLLSQIKTALQSNLYYLALYVTFTLPDICSALSSENGKTTPEKYINWYNKFARNKCSSRLDGFACYKFRCSTLHEGTTQNTKTGYSRVLFTESSTATIHDNILNDALNIDLNIFCLSMIQAVEEWLDQIQNDENFIKNYETFMKRYPNGLKPYIAGIPIIS